MAGELRAAIAKAIGLIGRVPKSGFNEFHRYKYATDSDIVGACRAAMAEAGVTIMCVDIQNRVVSTGKTGRGTEENRVYAQYVFEVGAVGTDETTRVTVCAGGADSGEKADLKAMTSAKKYAYSQVFALAPGDTADEASRDVTPGTEDAVAELTARLDAAYAEGNARTRLIERIARFQFTRAAPDTAAWSGGRARELSDLTTDELKQYHTELQDCVPKATVQEWTDLLEKYVVPDVEAARLLAVAAEHAGFTAAKPVANLADLPGKLAHQVVATARKDWSAFVAANQSPKRGSK